jgi:hypothetical protein
VNVNHAIIAKIFEDEVNISPFLKIVQKQPIKKKHNIFNENFQKFKTNYEL